MTKKKILIISAEVWRDDSNGGNVLSNIFQDFDAEFAQIYCNPGTPSNSLCKNYYQMTDNMILKNLFQKKEIGNILTFKQFPDDSLNNTKANTDVIKGYQLLRRLRFESFLVCKEILWNFSKWKNSKIENFILEFNPDIIFAPCYGSHFMLSLTRYVSEITNKPIISYISDDHYSLKQFRFSPVFWINRFLLRKNLRHTFKYYNLIYTMTQEQLEECKKAFNCNIKILKKGGDFSSPLIRKERKSTIKLVYAGGIYCGRWKTLSKIIDVINKINKTQKKFFLEIYTGNNLTKKQYKLLNSEGNCKVYGLVNQKELKDIYQKADIALHIEGLDLKNKLLTRVSFSTKIIDLLCSNCAVMAISWDKHSGYSYLKKEDAAICINNLNRLEEELNFIWNNKDIIDCYMEKAWRCGEKNHDFKQIRESLEKDFNYFLENSIK